MIEEVFFFFLVSKKSFWFICEKRSGIGRDGILLATATATTWPVITTLQLRDPVENGIASRKYGRRSMN